ncbi:MAG: hypothetical protein ABSD58_13595 [Verrucomicrobiia bacterium]|jgi:hypothetical protein
MSDGKIFAGISGLLVDAGNLVQWLKKSFLLRGIFEKMNETNAAPATTQPSKQGK